MQIIQGMIVYSDAGHDQKRFYVVTKTDSKYAYIADGKRRKQEKPKRKSFCHLKSTNTILENEMYQTNLKIRRVLCELNGKPNTVATREV